MEAISAKAAEGRDAFLQLAVDDAAAYDAVSAAFKLPRESDDEKTARTAAIQDALKGACEVPLKVMEQCLEIIGLAKNAVLSGQQERRVGRRRRRRVLPARHCGSLRTT